MKTPRTSTQTIISALLVLARDIESPDGVVNAAIAEAAERLAEFDGESRVIHEILRQAYDVLAVIEADDSDEAESMQLLMMSILQVLAEGHTS
jgi:hypothetical protein